MQLISFRKLIESVDREKNGGLVMENISQTNISTWKFDIM